MGLAASQTRFLSLTARKNDVEFQGQQVNQARTALASQSSELWSQYAEMDVPTAPNSTLLNYTDNSGVTYSWTNATDQGYRDALDAYERDKATYDTQCAVIDAETEEIQADDKQLELKLKELDSEQEAIQTELDSVKKVIDKNIDQTFKTFA